MKKKISYILLIFWLFVIFYLSSQSGNISGNISGGIIYNALSFVYKLFHLDTTNLFEIVKYIHNPLRELMHTLEYFILGILFINVLRQSNIKENIVIISIMLCFIYSATDEIHQLFVAGRTFEYFDIFMDNIGSILGTLLFNKIINKII